MDNDIPLYEYIDPLRHSPKVRPTDAIWRYIDFAKLVYLLQNKALFFALGSTMEDKFDGTFAVIGEGGHRIYNGIYDMANQQPTLALEDARIRESYSLSCWHLNEVESAAMWSLYSHRQMGIAIRSTVGRLQNSAKFSTYTDCYMGAVNYYNSPLNSALADPGTFFHKRASFEHEREYRVVLRPEVGSEAFTKMQGDKGVSVKVKLPNLIDSIWVGPFTLPWFEQLIRDVVNIRYKLNVPVIRSTVDSNPSIG